MIIHILIFISNRKCSFVHERYLHHLLCFRGYAECCMGRYAMRNDHIIRIVTKSTFLYGVLQASRLLTPGKMRRYMALERPILLVHQG